MYGPLKAMIEMRASRDLSIVGRGEDRSDEGVPLGGEEVSQWEEPKGPIDKSSYLVPRIACVYVGDELLGLWYSVAEGGFTE